MRRLLRGALITGGLGTVLATACHVQVGSNDGAPHGQPAQATAPKAPPPSAPPAAAPPAAPPPAHAAATPAPAGGTAVKQAAVVHPTTVQHAAAIGAPPHSSSVKPSMRRFAGAGGLVSPHKTAVRVPSQAELASLRQLQAHYAASEAAAPPAVKSSVAAARAAVLAHHKSFQVAVTEVSHKPLAQITGDVVPTVDAGAMAQAAAARAKKPLKTNLVAFSVRQRATPPARFLAAEANRENTGEGKTAAANGPTTNGTNQSGNNNATYPSSQFASPSAAAFSWRDRITAVKNQGGCGSCWAFAATGVLEAAEILFNGQPQTLDLAEQQLVNCVPVFGPGSENCGGNSSTNAYKFLKGSSHALESSVPYKASVLSCDGSAGAAAYAVDDWAYAGEDSASPTVDEIKSAIIAHGPISSSVHVSPAFQHYAGGVFDEDDPGATNHAVVLVGWDDAKGAWHLRNSWSERWGEGGYMWIKYGANKIGTRAAWISPVHPPQPPAPTFGDRYLTISNDSGEPLDVSVEGQTQAGAWVPAAPSANAAAFTFTVPTGGKLDVKRTDNKQFLTAKAARIWAKSKDGKRQWNQFKTADFVLAQAPYQAQKRERSTFHFGRAAAAEPTADEVFAQADGARKGGDSAKAEALFQKFADHFASDARIHDARFWLGYSQYAQKKYPDATMTLYNMVSSAPDGHPDIPFGTYFMAMSLAAQGDCGYAVRNFETVAYGEIGSPQDWIDSAKNNIKHLEADDGTICSSWD